MSKISSIEDLRIWQDSIKISIDLYKEFSNCRDFGFKDQILRAGVSVPSNIAEGFERNNDKEFVRFLKFSKGSAGEIRTQLVIAKAVGLLEETVADNFISRIISVSKQIQTLINSVNYKLGR